MSLDQQQHGLPQSCSKCITGTTRQSSWEHQLLVALPITTQRSRKKSLPAVLFFGSFQEHASEHNAGTYAPPFHQERLHGCLQGLSPVVVVSVGIMRWLVGFWCFESVVRWVHRNSLWRLQRSFHV